MVGVAIAGGMELGCVFSLEAMSFRKVLSQHLSCRYFGPTVNPEEPREWLSHDLVFWGPFLHWLELKGPSTTWCTACKQKVIMADTGLGGYYWTELRVGTLHRCPCFCVCLLVVAVLSMACTPCILWRLQEWCGLCFKNLTTFVFEGAFHLHGDTLPFEGWLKDESNKGKTPLDWNFVCELRKWRSVCQRPRPEGAAPVPTLTTEVVMTLSDLADALNVPRLVSRDSAMVPPSLAFVHRTCFLDLQAFTCAFAAARDLPETLRQHRVERTLWRDGADVEFRVLYSCWSRPSECACWGSVGQGLPMCLSRAYYSCALLMQPFFIFSERDQQFQFVKGILAKNVLELYQRKDLDGVRERIINCFEMSDHSGTPFTTDGDPLRVSYSCFTPEFYPRWGAVRSIC